MLEQLLQHLPQTLVPVAVVVVIQLLRTYCRPAPLPNLATTETPSLEMLDGRFHKFQWAVAVLYFCSAAAFAVGSWKLLESGNEWLASLDGPGVYTLYPSAAIWWLFSGFGAFTFGWVIMEFLLPFMLGRDTARIYLYWTSARAGLNASKVFRWGALLAAGPIGFLTILALPVHTTFREDRIVFRPYASITAKSYGYDKIRALTTTDGIRNRFGKFVPDPCILVDFDDGTQWSSGDLLRDPDRSIDAGLRAFLAGKTRVPFRHVPFAKDLWTKGPNSL